MKPKGVTTQMKALNENFLIVVFTVNTAVKGINTKPRYKRERLSHL